MGVMGKRFLVHLSRLQATPVDREQRAGTEPLLVRAVAREEAQLTPHEGGHPVLQILEPGDAVHDLDLPPLGRLECDQPIVCMVAQWQLDQRSAWRAVKVAPKLLVAPVVASPRRAPVHLREVARRVQKGLRTRLEHKQAARRRRELLGGEYGGRVPHHRGGLCMDGQLVNVARERHVIIEHDDLLELREPERGDPAERELVKARRPAWRLDDGARRDLRAQATQPRLPLRTPIAAHHNVYGHARVDESRRADEPLDTSRLSRVSVHRPAGEPVPQLAPVEVEE